MFEGFESRHVEGAGADIFVRTRGTGAPMLLLHGYPETSAMWAGIADQLAQQFSLVIADLRGYGRSSAPDSREGEGYSKRVMASDMAAVMTALGHERFRVAGHDRGARVAYRLALDSPARVERLAVIDIVPTLEVWEAMDAAAAMKTYHWQFLAQPYPLPEHLIAADPDGYLDHTIASWTATGTLDAFDPAALAEYRASFRQPERTHAACEDYRAGWAIDRLLDAEDRAAGRRIQAPTLALWGTGGLPAAGPSPLEVWRKWCVSVQGHPIEGGHFLVEEAPAGTLAALLDFFGR